MRWAAVFLTVCVGGSAVAQEAVQPARRTIEYSWMSVAQWNQMHENILKQVKAGPADVVFLGDSITQGWSGDGKRVWEQHYAPLKAVNLGIGGDMTQQVLWRITEGKELEGVSPKVVVLLIGTNNFGLGGHAPEDVAKGVGRVVETLQAKLPEAKILLLGIFPRDAQPGTGFRKNITAANVEIKKLDNGKTVRYLDLTSKLLDDQGVLPKEMMPDALHLSEAGYKVWAAEMQPLLTELMK